MTAPTTTLPLSMGEGPFALATSALAKRFGAVAALDGVDLQVPTGAVYALVGPNGAGKSTLLRALMGLTARDAGAVDVLGADPRTDGAGTRARIGYVPEDHRIGYAWMTVGRLLRHHEAYFPAWDAAYARRLADALEIDGGRRCHTLSKGQARRVQILLALAHRPPVLLLDEPTDGLDHVVRDHTLELLSAHLADHPTTVLVSTHRAYEIESLVDHVGVLAEGRLLGQLPRTALESRLLRYWAEAPEGWTAPSVLAGSVVRRSARGREIEWTVWGEREAVVRDLEGTGVMVREVATLSLDEAALALLSRKEAS